MAEVEPNDSMDQAQLLTGDTMMVTADLEMDGEDWYVLEMSSFQLETASTPCLIGGAILNIDVDHLFKGAWKHLAG